MIEFSNTKLLKNYPMSRIVEFDFIDLELSEENKEKIELDVLKYKPPIKGLKLNKELSQIEFNSTIAHIALALRIPHYMAKSTDKIVETVKTSFIDYYNDIN
jgi:hypothetical protein